MDDGSNIYYTAGKQTPENKKTLHPKISGAAVAT